MFFPNQWDGFNRFKGLPKFFDANSHTFKSSQVPTTAPMALAQGTDVYVYLWAWAQQDPVASQQVVSHPGGRVEISGRAWLLRPYSWTFTRCASLAVRGVNYSLAPPKFSHLYLLLTCASNYSLAPPLLLTCASTTFPLAPPLKSNSLLKLSPLLLSTMPWSKI